MATNAVAVPKWVTVVAKWTLFAVKVLIAPPLWAIASLIDLVRSLGGYTWTFEEYMFTIWADIVCLGAITGALVFSIVSWLVLGTVGWLLPALLLAIYVLAGLVVVSVASNMD